MPRPMLLPHWTCSWEIRRYPNQNEFKQYTFNRPVSIFRKGKLYSNTTLKMMELPEKKARKDFPKSLDAINASVLRTHYIRREGHDFASASAVHYPIVPT